NAGATQTIGFAMLVGDSSLANIQTNADAAKAKWVALRKANFLPVSVSEEGNDLPRVFGLSQNYPNPFNPTTSFELQVAGYEFVSLKVYDLLGREVATLLNERKSPGTYKITWDASHLPSGVYLYRMTAGSFVETKKLVLMK
ncbi:MAG: T9SS type A sorting domain-containing protein, partial [Ignavibacteriales bacterium]|nr:T9SS type A sorting domain-containing protein [Ignavibacteriales bacterium]